MHHAHAVLFLTGEHLLRYNTNSVVYQDIG